MALRQFTINFSAISKDEYLRNDEKYHYFLHNSGWNLFKHQTKNLVCLKDVLIDDYNRFDFQEGENYRGIPTGQIYLDKDGYITNFENITLDNHPNRLKYKVSNDNILISSLRLSKSPALYFNDIDLTNYVFSNGFYVFKVKPGWNIKFILYVLRTKRLKAILDNNLYRGIGISAYKDMDLKKIKIPLIPKDRQDLSVTKIKPIEKKIKELKKRIKPHQEVIDEVFIREFGFDINKFIELLKVRNYEAELSAFSNNVDLRFSVNFHNLAGFFVLEELKKRTLKKIKHFIAEPITLGASISPSDFDESGDFYYVSMATVKNYILELDESQLVSNNYSRENINKSIKKDDILMTRSGVAIGKFALIQEDVNGVFADFTMRIRLKNYNPLFAYYYFRSTYFQHLIHTNKKGLQNKNIFPNQIQEFPMIDITLERQARIVDEIKKILDEQKLIKQKIKTERNKIVNIIESAIA